MNNGEGRRLNGENEEDDNDDSDDADLEAWERTYADERSWESLQEDESGRLQTIDNQTHHAQYRRRLRSLSAARIQKGIIRYLYIIIDLSKVTHRVHVSSLFRFYIPLIVAHVQGYFMAKFCYSTQFMFGTSGYFVLFDTLHSRCSIKRLNEWILQLLCNNLATSYFM